VERDCLLPPFQFGFRPHKSCTDALITLFSYVHNSFLEGEMTFAAFIDIEGAFDNVDPNILLEELRLTGVPARTCKFIANLLFERKNFFLKQGHLTGPFIARKGTPQGSALSPLLFDIYLRDIGSVIDKDVRIIQYADDITLLVSSRNASAARDKIQIALCRVQKYLSSKGLNLAPAKSQVMIFENSRRATIPPPIQVKGKTVPLVDRARFLGVMLDKSLSGREHLRFLCQKGKGIVDVMASLAGTWWGAHPQLLLTLYRALFRSVIEYGSQVFRFTGNRTRFLRVQRLQYRSIRIAYGYRVSTPTNILLAESRELTLKSRFTRLAHKYMHKTYANPRGLVYSALTQVKKTAMLKNPSERARVLVRFPLLTYFLRLEGNCRDVY
jgi:hypothetical protein